MIFTWRYGHSVYSLWGDRTDPKRLTTGIYASISTYDFLSFIKPCLIRNPDDSHSIMVRYKSLLEAVTEFNELAMLYYPGSTIKDRP